MVFYYTEISTMKTGKKCIFNNYQQQFNIQTHSHITNHNSLFCYEMARPIAVVVEESVEGGVGKCGKFLSGLLECWWPEDLDKC